MRASVATLLLVLATTAAQAGTELLFIQPGGPGSTKKAAKVMAEFARLVERAAPALAPVTATYLNDRPAIEKQLTARSPAFAMVSLDFYLHGRARWTLTPIGVALPAGKAPSRYHVLARKADARTLAELAGGRWTGQALSHRAFLAAIVLAGTQAPERLAPNARPLRAIRDCVREKADVVVLDGPTFAALKQLPRYGDALRLVHSSAPLPPAPIVRFGSPSVDLLPALVKLSADPAAAELLKTFQLRGFAPLPEPSPYPAVEKRHDAWVAANRPK